MSNKIKVTYRDGIIDTTTKSFSWKERLKILFGQKLFIKTVIETEFRCGRVQSETIMLIDNAAEDGISPEKYENHGK